MQTKTPKHQPANDSEDDSDSSIGSDSSKYVSRGGSTKGTHLEEGHKIILKPNNIMLQFTRIPWES